MKLIRFGQPGEEKPGVLHNNKRLDVSSFVFDYDENFFGNNGIDLLEEWLSKNMDACPLVEDGERLGPPMARP